MRDVVLHRTRRGLAGAQSLCEPPPTPLQPGECGAHLLEHVCSQRIVRKELAGEDQPLVARGRVLWVLLVQQPLHIPHTGIVQRHRQAKVLVRAVWALDHDLHGAQSSLILLLCHGTSAEGLFFFFPNKTRVPDLQGKLSWEGAPLGMRGWEGR